MYRTSTTTQPWVSVAVVVAFFVCWAPFQVQRLYSVFGFAGDDTTHTAFLVHKVMTYESGIFYYLSTTINPILYNIMSLKFRQAFKRDLNICPPPSIPSCTTSCRSSSVRRSRCALTTENCNS
ncbi:neuromedin U receptor activity protein [Homalodisca vitripennis]|nr:neuromedin U receptor activity protein [Homalodisca vitripennis]